MPRQCVCLGGNGASSHCRYLYIHICIYIYIYDHTIPTPFFLLTSILTIFSFDNVRICIVEFSQAAMHVKKSLKIDGPGVVTALSNVAIPPVYGL